MSLVQDANPDPPIAFLPRLSASVQWREIFAGRLVANFSVERPTVYVNRAHLAEELSDDVDVKERGWQEVTGLRADYVRTGPGRPRAEAAVRKRAALPRSTRSFVERPRISVAPSPLEDYVVQAMPDVSPTKWHLAHVTRTLVRDVRARTEVLCLRGASESLRRLAALCR